MTLPCITSPCLGVKKPTPHPPLYLHYSRDGLSCHVDNVKEYDNSHAICYKEECYEKLGEDRTYIYLYPGGY